MKKCVIKKIGLFLVLAACSHTGFGQYPSLSDQSKQEIVISALKGAAVSVGSYMGLFFLSHNFRLPLLTNRPGSYLIAAGIGATIMGLWRYNHVPESHFSYAKKGTIELTSNRLFDMLLHVPAHAMLNSLKDYFFNERLPLITSFKRLNSLYERLQSYIESFEFVLSSNQTDLYQESQQYILKLENYQALIKEAIKQIKEDPNYIAESNAQTMHEMQIAQANMAAAANSSALAQWAKPDPAIIIY